MIDRHGHTPDNPFCDRQENGQTAPSAAVADARSRPRITLDGAGASHGLIARLDKLAARRGYQLTYSVGRAVGERERDAITGVPAQAWEQAVDGRGEVRERRADDACGGRDCGHRRCWVEEAHVTELTALLRQGRDGDQLAAWPESMRVFARRERPHPGAQLTLPETRDGWRYTLWVTNLPAAERGWRSRLPYIDAAHRVHARVEDRIRTGKDCGIGHFPSRSLAINTAWLTASLLAATLLAWLRHLGLDGDLAKAEPKALRYASCMPPPGSSAALAAASCASPPPGPGPATSPQPGSRSPRCPRHPDQQARTRRPGKDTIQGPVEPPAPSRQPGPPAYPGTRQGLAGRLASPRPSITGSVNDQG